MQCSSPRALIWARVVELRIDICLTQILLRLTQFMCNDSMYQVLYIINARIRIVQNFVDRPSASTSSASSRGVFVLLYKAFIRAKIYGKQGNPVMRFYKQRYAERYVILLI